jgi:hypothetical protein
MKNSTGRSEGDTMTSTPPMKKSRSNMAAPTFLIKRKAGRGMKARRVFVQLELETTAPLKALRTPANWAWANATVLQASANVAQAVSRKKKARGKA